MVSSERSRAPDKMSDERELRNYPLIFGGGESEARVYMSEMVDAVFYLHEVAEMLHRDIKSDNVFLMVTDQVKLADFGSAVRIEDSCKGCRLCGTSGYVSPQVLQKKGHSTESEAWSLGCVLYCMVVGKAPFHADTASETYSRIAACEYTLPKQARLPTTATSLITRQLLESDMEKRLKIVEIKNHEFFTDVPLASKASYGDENLESATKKDNEKGRETTRDAQWCDVDRWGAVSNCRDGREDTMHVKLVLFTTSLMVTTRLAAGELSGIISKFISSYDAVSYEPLISRKTRSVGEYAVPVNIRFDAINRSFDLLLTPVDRFTTVFDEDVQIDVDGSTTLWHESSFDLLLTPVDRFTTVFDEDVQIDVDGSTIHLSPSDFLYRGYDKSDEDSFIYGSLINGVFSGHIRYRTGESFTVESAKLYFTNESSSHFHSVIYPDTAIKFFNSSRHKRSNGGEFPGCGLTGERLQRMLRFQKRHASTSTEEKQDVIDKVSETEKLRSRTGKTAGKRIINGNTVYDARDCDLYIRTDQVLFKHVFNSVGEGDYSRQDCLDFIC
ncbi:Serine/threonine-protein kinase PLK1 [Toxocara canis]|uniref:Serine/threonine-protein kinase PLK1 n=1 Tax=Toxocara canis TaxID=6265 RepID=A0A0B2VW69_TOXCA|nr:Serine/threonine-protein kinase PLK1 [Toxocara canis]